MKLHAPSGRLSRDEYNPSASPNLLEHPTAAPRHPAVFFYRQLSQQNALYAAEIERLNDVYPAEIMRLNAEIAELYAEIAKLYAIIRSPRQFPLEFPKFLVAAAIHRLISNRLVRQIGRRIMMRLPDDLATRIRMRVVLLLARR